MITYVLAGAASALIGLASGQLLVLSAGRRRLALRLAALEQQVPELISRSEVQNAFAQVAQLEAQRQAQAQAQARAVSAFGAPTAPAGRGELNQGINAQLEALQARISRLNSEFGLPG